MSSVEAWGIVVAVTVVTYATRAVGILALAGRTLPDTVERALRHVGPAVLAALVADIAAGDGGTWPALSPAEAAGLVVAAVVAWWRRNILLSLVAGLGTFWVLLAVGWG
jgi:branched-subunit amino acid transport protein